MKNLILNLARRFTPVKLRRKIIRYTRWPPVGFVRFGNLRRLKPISPDWGSERGMPIDRYYITQFLSQQVGDIQGRVLEIGDDKYTRQFGGSQVTSSEVLHVAEQKEKVTLIGDLARPEDIPINSFDCIILTQTLQTIYDLTAVVNTVYQALKPGGVVLVTIPGISKISRYDMDRWGYYWSFTTQSAKRLFEASFPTRYIQVRAYGNVLTATAFLQGLAAGELRPYELDYHDPDYEVLIGLRAQKPETIAMQDEMNKAKVQE